MSFIDCILLTLINTVACLAFPKLLSMILTLKTKKTAPSPTPITAPESGSEVPSFS
ncbi:hypothetical protein [Nostoc sp. T09]|uniref:hypothetical protein n=1 Tax=Nostoc sp. T09 TaxID=1932621 RepID=UPI0015C52049|nr:hypothetical protein [Nostoc sp. T09]